MHELISPSPAKTASKPPSGRLLSSLKEMAFDRAVLVYFDTTCSPARTVALNAKNRRTVMKAATRWRMTHRLNKN